MFNIFLLPFLFGKFSFSDVLQEVHYAWKSMIQWLNIEPWANWREDSVWRDILYSLLSPVGCWLFFKWIGINIKKMFQQGRESCLGYNFLFLHSLDERTMMQDQDIWRHVWEWFWTFQNHFCQALFSEKWYEESGFCNSKITFKHTLSSSGVLVWCVSTHTSRNIDGSMVSIRPVDLSKKRRLLEETFLYWFLSLFVNNKRIGVVAQSGQSCCSTRVVVLAWTGRKRLGNRVAAPQKDLKTVPGLMVVI